MKISILTPTYNRGELLKKLYDSILANCNKSNLQVEWLIMDDGSTDNTKTVVEKFKGNNKFNVKYFYQQNAGKMKSLNNLIPKSKGNLIIECDSDDYFSENAFEIIEETIKNNLDINNIYAFAFLKYDQDGKNMGNKFPKNSYKSNMFDLYFKEGLTGEKALVFISDIRKQYMHELENNEKFVTEARMYHKMDLKYKIVCINKPIMICEYQKEGYSKNIKKEFKDNPFGYYKYFKEILMRNMKGVTLKKRLYVIKHYILFTQLTNQKTDFKNIKSIRNKILYCALYIPGIIKTKIEFR